MEFGNSQRLSGKGTVAGDITMNSGSVLSVGDLIGTLTFSNSLTLTANSTTVLQIGKTPLTNDQISVGAVLNSGGSLLVVQVDATQLAVGDTFHLFRAVSSTGLFSNVVLPALPAGLGWNLDMLYSSGVVSVARTSWPVINSFTFSGSSLTVNGTGGVGNVACYLLGATNLAIPLTNWTRLLTNWADNSGNITVTNMPNINQPQYFLLFQQP